MFPQTILGIDPGTATTGFGVIQVVKDGLELVDYGLISTDKDGAPEKRLATIFDEMNTLFTRFNPHIMAIEKVFFSTNVKTAIRVGQAQGVMLLAAAHRRVPIAEYAPGTIKKQVTGSGRADKKQMMSSVIEIFGSKVHSRSMGKTHFDNAADALAIAMCHAFLERDKLL